MIFDLEEKCPECGGGGVIRDINRFPSHGCGICKGRGTVPNRKGQAILELVEKYGGRPLDTITHG